MRVNSIAYYVFGVLSLNVVFSAEIREPVLSKVAVKPENDTPTVETDDWQENDENKREKKSATTTFCVEIRPTDNQKPYQVCEPASAALPYPAPAPSHPYPAPAAPATYEPAAPASSYSTAAAAASTFATHAAKPTPVYAPTKSYAAPAPAPKPYAAAAHSGSSYSAYRNVEKEDLKSRMMEVPEDDKEEKKEKDAKEDNEVMRKAGGGFGGFGGYGAPSYGGPPYGAGFGGHAGALAGAPVSFVPALPKKQHSGLVITCQPNLAGYAHGIGAGPIGEHAGYGAYRSSSGYSRPYSYGSYSHPAPYKQPATYGGASVNTGSASGSFFHGAPVPVFKAPHFSATASSHSGYGAPSVPSYSSDPAPTYSAPAPSYSDPAPSYGGLSAAGHGVQQSLSHGIASQGYAPSAPAPTYSDPSYGGPSASFGAHSSGQASSISSFSAGAPAFSAPAVPSYSAPVAPAYSAPAAPIYGVPAIQSGYHATHAAPAPYTPPATFASASVGVNSYRAADAEMNIDDKEPETKKKMEELSDHTPTETLRGQTDVLTVSDGEEKVGTGWKPEMREGTEGQKEDMLENELE